MGREPLASTVADNEFGAYIHIPFCATRCDYCAFATWTDRGEMVDRYVDAVVAEIERTRSVRDPIAFSTLYFGGGTPSLIGAGRLGRILEAFDRVPSTEVTVECNPESTTGELVQSLVEQGVTRISLGVQSLDHGVLDGLGRTHTNGSTWNALRDIAAAQPNSYSVDLIYGGPNETDQSWRDTIEQVCSSPFAPPHISAYGLIVEPGTPLSRDRSRHPDDDVEARRYAIADAVFSSYGYRWYELSNWSLPGHECRHNLACWMQGDYLGYGCSAHSHVRGHRFSNVVSIDRYLERIEHGTSTVATEEWLSREERALERLQLQLRTSFGVPGDALDGEAFELGLVERSDDRIVLTLRGRLLANEVTHRLRLP